MRTFWLKFEDGSEGYCDGTTPFDVVAIAEHFTGKRVAGERWRYKQLDNPNIKGMPYPVRNMIWQYEHPVYGKHPTFCGGHEECRGRGACPRDPACTE